MLQIPGVLHIVDGPLYLPQLFDHPVLVGFPVQDARSLLW